MPATSNASLTLISATAPFGNQGGNLVFNANFLGNYASGSFLAANALASTRHSSGGGFRVNQFKGVVAGTGPSGARASFKNFVKRGASAITALAYTSPQPSNVVFTAPLTVTAVSTANPAVFTVSSVTWTNPNGSTQTMADNDVISSTVIGSSVTAVNGVFRVANFNAGAKTFTLVDAAGTGINGSGVSFTSGSVKRLTNNLAVTVTCNTHGLCPGEMIRVRQVQGATTLNTTGSTMWTITSVTGVNTFVAQTNLTTLGSFSTSSNSIVETIRPFAEQVVSGMARSDGSTAIDSKVWPAGAIVFTCSAAHGLVKGDTVYITNIPTSGTQTPTWADSYKPLIVTDTNSTSFTLNLQTVYSAFTGVTTTNVRVSAVRSLRMLGNLVLEQDSDIGLATVAGSPATFTSRAAHNLKVGDLVFANVPGTGAEAMNGTFRVRTVPSTTTCTLETTAGVPVNTAGTPTADACSLSGMFEIVEGAPCDTFATVQVLLGSEPSTLVGPFLL